MRNRQPAPGLVFHSGLGIEYAAFEYRARLCAQGILQSMNRPDKMNDNAHMESFFPTVEGAMGTTDKLTQEEVRAFHDACAVRGRDGKDFTLELLTVDSGSSQIQSRIVAVRRDGIQRCYDASFGADWIGQFIDDMRAGRWLQEKAPLRGLQ